MSDLSQAHAAALKFSEGMTDLPKRRHESAASKSTHRTHVMVWGVEFEVHYDSTGVLEHAYVTQLSPGYVSSTEACGPDLADWLHTSQRTAIEQQILHQSEREEQRARHCAAAPF